MTDYYVELGGSNTSPYDTWLKAATSEQTIIPLAVSGDRVFIRNSFTRTGSAASAITLNFADGVRVISMSWDGVSSTGGSYSPGAQIATSTTGGLTVNTGSYYGIYLHQGSGSSNGAMSLATTDGNSVYFEDCRLRLITTGGSSNINMGTTSGTANNTSVRMRNCSITFANTSQSINVRTYLEDLGSFWADAALSSSSPTTLFKAPQSAARFSMQGSDFSAITGTLFSGSGNVHFRADLFQCIIYGAVTRIGTQTSANAGEVFMWACSASDSQYEFEHYSYRGNTVVPNTVYMTSGNNTHDGGTTRYSWKVTGVNVTKATPYFSPYLNKLFDSLIGTSVNPYLEIGCTDSATAPQDDEIKGEFELMTTSGSAVTDHYDDGTEHSGGTASNQAAGAGTGSWAGSVLVSNKVDAGGSHTIQERGYARARVAVMVARTFYVHPDILY